MKNATVEPKTASSEYNVADCEPNPWNKRRALDPAFVDSIRDQGVLSPGLMRPNPDGDGYQIICGERRWAASKEAGKETWPAVVRDMGDEEARLCTLIENTHREDMTAWQEAQLIHDLLSRPGWDIALAAAATGWDEGLIRRRAKLLEVSPSWKKELEAGVSGKLPMWTVGHFETLTIFDEKKQESLYEELRFHADGLSIQDLRQQISEFSETLGSAPWELDDVTLCPSIGSCLACPKRTGANEDLFGGTDAKVKKADKCLDKDCFKKKLAAFGKKKTAATLEKQPEAIKIAKEWGRTPKGALSPMQYDQAKKGDKGAVPAVVVDGKGVGTLTYVKPRKGAEVALEKAKSPKDKAAEEKAARLARIDALAIEKLCDYVEDKDGDLEFTKEALPVLTQFALVFGLDFCFKDEEKRIMDYAAKPVTSEELWDECRDRMVENLHNAKHSLSRNGGRAAQMPAVKLCAWMVDADFGAMVKDAETELAKPADAPAPVQGKEAESDEDKLWDLPDDEGENADEE